MDDAAVGRKGAPVAMRVEHGKIREFARAIKDPNPVYLDAEAARSIGGIVAPPTFLMTAAHWDDGRGRPDLGMDLKRVLHGEQEFEYRRPLRAGDMLTAQTTVERVYEKKGKRGGTMTFAVTATEFRDAAGEVVAISRSTVIETGRVVES